MGGVVDAVGAAQAGGVAEGAHLSLGGPTRRSLPRPLMPLLLFLYSVAKYSHRSRSDLEAFSKSLMEPNLAVSCLMVST